MSARTLARGLGALTLAVSTVVAPTPGIATAATEAPAVVDQDELQDEAQTTQGATTCKIRVARFKRGGEFVADLCQGRSGNTFSLQSRNSLRNVEKFMLIRGCTGDSINPRKRCVTDKGQYTHYAGPITIGGCRVFDVKMNNGRGTTLIDKTIKFCR